MMETKYLVHGGIEEQLTFLVYIPFPLCVGKENENKDMKNKHDQIIFYRS